MTTAVNKRLERIEKQIAAMPPYTVTVYPMRAGLVPLPPNGLFGVCAADAAYMQRRADFHADFSYLSGEELDQFMAEMTPDDLTFEALPADIRRDLLDYIRKGEIAFDPLREEFNDRIARRAFEVAGVSYEG